MISRLRQKATTQARSLRKEETAPEERLWTELREKRLGAFKFRRQHPVPPYILDFACRPLKLGIEVDGPSHFTQDGQEKDRIRTAFLKEKGWTIIRFTNEEVFKHLDSVLDAIWQAARDLEAAK